MLSTVSVPSAAQDQPVATFKSGVELVRVSRGGARQEGPVRPEPDDSRLRDFRRRAAAVRLPSSGKTPAPSAWRCCSTSAAAWRSGSRTRVTRRRHVLSWLDEQQDEVAVFTFDTRLSEVVPFTTGLEAAAGQAGHDRTVRRDVAARCDCARRPSASRIGAGLRRAVVVFTDGVDTASRLTARRGLGDRQRHRRAGLHLRASYRRSTTRRSSTTLISATPSPLAGALADLAAWTGGHVFVASTPATRSASARQIVDELRQQYLIAFESSGRPGWHPLVVRARGKDLTVRARSGYHRGAISPDFVTHQEDRSCSGRSSSLAPDRRPRRRLHGLRDEEVRPHRTSVK